MKKKATEKQQLAFFDGGEKAEIIKSAALTPEAERLLANFHVLADASGGIKRLRELVLALAVQGKLVPQDAQDESAKILAEKIAAARPKLAAKWSMRIGTRLPPVEEADEPYALPASWQWMRLGDFGGFLGGGTPSKAKSSFWEGSMPWVSPKDMKRPYIDDAEDHISEAAIEGSSVKLIPTGSLLFVIRGMILAHSFPTALTTKPVTINQDMKALVLALPTLGEYLLRACQAARARMLQRVEHSSHGTCRLDSEEVERFPIALPPLAEQARIVAKVDELMALCDEMAARQAKRRVAAGRLNKAALGELTSADGPEESAASLQRVVGNFEALVEAPTGVKQLRELILTLAVQGKLLPQDARDESAKILAEKIADARPQVAAKWSMRIGTRLPRVEEADEPYAIPASWRWMRLGDFGGFLGGGTPSKANSAFWEGSMPWVSPKDMKRPYIDDAEDHISEAAIEGSSVKLIPTGSLLFVIRGMILAHSFPTALTTKPVTINQDMKALVLALPILGEYLLRACQAARPRMLQRVERSSHGTCRLDSEEVERFPIALPPLAEQARIVAKVDHLMALCDTLEARLRAADEGARRLAESLVAELIA